MAARVSEDDGRGDGLGDATQSRGDCMEVAGASLLLTVMFLWAGRGLVPNDHGGEGGGGRQRQRVRMSLRVRVSEKVVLGGG